MSQPAMTLNKVVTEIAAITGFNAHGYRPTTLKRRLELRLSATLSRNYRDYLAYLKKDPTEGYRFLDALFITVTDFFRDRAVFSCLEKEIFPGLIEEISAKKKNKLSVWSIGCSQGQEAYSLAMILDLVRRKKGKSLKMSILATDVSAKSLNLARRALYRRAEMKNIPPRYQHEFFKKINNDGFQVIGRIRKMVRFKQHDLIQEGGTGRFHLISCRNMLIFLTADGQHEMFLKLHCCLRKRGILVLGTAETPREEGLFQCLSSAHHVFRKVPAVSPTKTHSGRGKNAD
jgi:chemotaxis methyl-accepting protein methylase